ncbi:ATP-binding protein [Wukongibacter baidiensis]|uniref:sensor histidine kinase n=1 Tax=Wukongibacter baidiensis TaxID=1723361 RepID=UPI003D7FA8CF
MSKKSITFKLFVITSIFLMILLGSAMATQTIFFDDYFVSRKIERLVERLEEFSQEYKGSKWDERSIQNNIRLFSMENDAQIAVLNEERLVKYMNYVSITIIDSKGEEIIIPLSNFLQFFDRKDLNINVGDDITIEGVNILGKILVPLRIQNNGVILDVKDVAEEDKIIYIYETDINSVDKITGKVKAINLPSNINGIANYDEEVFLVALDDFLFSVESGELRFDEGLMSYIFEDTMRGTQNIIIAKQTIKDYQVDEVIFVMSSLNAVREMNEIMRDYYIYVAIGALIFIIILSFIYSKLISKPLVKVNEVAERMADLDFSSYCEVKSDDEIGSLSRSLNTLSKNLSNSLEELKGANEKLLEDIEKEKRLEEMRKEFVSSVSHELKTPLGIIKGFAEGIKDGIYEEKKEYYLDVILDEVEKMEDLVLDMLDLSKLESKSYRLTKEKFFIDQLFLKVIDKFKNHIASKNINIVFQCEGEDVSVHADRKRIEQVIVNLLSNAIRHTNNEGTITFSIIVQDERVNVSIENNGESISKEKINRIWDRFYRIEESRVRQAGGTGLGLAIVKNILELHDSNYGVRNTEDGVEFYFSLPKIELL